MAAGGRTTFGIAHTEFDFVYAYILPHECYMVDVSKLTMEHVRLPKILLPTVLVLLLAPLAAAMPMSALADTTDSFEALDGARNIVAATISDRTYALTASLTSDAIQIIDITDPTSPLPVAALFGGQGGFVLNDVSDIAIVAVEDKTFALTASFGANSIQVIDITDPASPLSVATIVDGQGDFVLGGPFDITILTTPEKTYALVANLLSDSIQVIDITDPASPLPVAMVVDGQDGFDALEGARSIELIEISGTIYALGSGWNDDAIQIIDVTDPTSPLPVTSVFDEQGGFDALASAGSVGTATISGKIYAVVAGTTDDAIQIIDITDPTSPLPVTSVFDGDPWPTHPSAPLPTPGILDDQSNFSLNSPGDIVMFETGGHWYAIVASSDDDAIQVIDVTDPARPLPVATMVDGQDGFDALGGAHGVALATIGERTYALAAASDDGAVQVIDITDPIAPLPTANVFGDKGGLDVAGGTADVDTSVVAQSRFNAASIEARVHALVIETALLYNSAGEAIFDDITPSQSVSTYDLYPFVLDAETFEVVADGANPALLGAVPNTFKEADRPFDQIREDLHRDGAMWLHHMQANPDTGTIQLKRTWLYLHDGYVFGSGYYVHDSQVQAIVDEAIRKYETGGTTAFDEITPEKEIITDDLYAFILDANTAQTVAHEITPSLVGEISDTFLHRAEKPYTQIKAELNQDGHTWVSYVFTNPDAHTQQLKRTWLVLHDGYIFASGYYLPDSRVQSLVEGAIQLYQSHGEEAFDIITPRSPAYTDALYPFVLNFTTTETVAHGAFPDLLTVTSTVFLNEADRPYEEIQTDLIQNGSTWISYVFTNPDTRTDQLKRVWLTLHDGYIFASGYYLPDSRVQSLVDAVISTYRSVGTEAFDIVNSGADSLDDSFYVTIVSGDGTLLASGVPTDTILSRAHGLVVERDRSVFQIYGDLTTDGHVWLEDMHLHPFTYAEQVRRTWLYQYDNYIFSSGYFLTDSEVQSQVDRAIFLYRTHGEAAFDIITPDQPRDDEAALYPFVITANNYTTVAHGAIPAFVGECCSDAIRNTSDRSFNDVLSDIHEAGGAWVTYNFTNPDTGTTQPKRTFLYQYGDFIFGSGYYIDDSQVQALARNVIHVYNAHPTNAFAMIDAVADEEETVDLYPFVIDPETLEIKAQGIGPSGAGTDLAALTNADRTMDEVLAALKDTSGTWSEYHAVNPLNGETEPKRSWLTTHDGLIFGVGYYNP